MATFLAHAQHKDLYNRVFAWVDKVVSVSAAIALNVVAQHILRVINWKVAYRKYLCLRVSVMVGNISCSCVNCRYKVFFTALVFEQFYM